MLTVWRHRVADVVIIRFIAPHVYYFMVFAIYALLYRLAHKYLPTEVLIRVRRTLNAQGMLQSVQQDTF